MSKVKNGEEVALGYPKFVGYKILRHDPSPIQLTHAIPPHLYWGDCGCWNGLAWCSTKADPVKVYTQKGECLEILKRSIKKWPDVEFKVVKAYAKGEDILKGEISDEELNGIMSTPPPPENNPFDFEEEARPSVICNEIRDEADDIFNFDSDDEVPF